MTAFGMDGILLKSQGAELLREQEPDSVSGHAWEVDKS